MKQRKYSHQTPHFVAVRVSIYLKNEFAYDCDEFMKAPLSKCRCSACHRLGHLVYFYSRLSVVKGLMCKLTLFMFPSAPMVCHYRPWMHIAGFSALHGDMRMHRGAISVFSGSGLNVAFNLTFPSSLFEIFYPLGLFRHWNFSLLQDSTSNNGI